MYMFQSNSMLEPTRRNRRPSSRRVGMVRYKKEKQKLPYARFPAKRRENEYVYRSGGVCGRGQP